MKIFSFIVLISLIIACDNSSRELEWPDITQITKPWTRWWWMGSAVNFSELSTAMEEYKKAGLGGVEITPVYGVKGYEDKFIKYLSREWVDMLIHTLEEGKRLDLGVDMATGTGWPFGGPWVNEDHACKYVTYKTYILKEGDKLKETINYIQTPMVRAVIGSVDISELNCPVADNKNLQELALDQVRFEKSLPLQVLMAYSDKGNILDLTSEVDSSGKLLWTAKEGNWKLYAVFQGWHGKMVERAAPGGETNVIDHFSKQAFKIYLEEFDKAFKKADIQYLRAFFNDSYEVDDAYGEADWTPEIFNEFIKRRGYDLRDHLPELFTQDSTEENIRVLCDYRETISELLLEEFTLTWKEWAKNKKALIRNQAHGSPANILDLYAAADIPETEGRDILRIKFASSASNVTGKQLTSSESATWLDEHFLASLGDVKATVDNYFLGGINHIFYHGTTFSPEDEPWPGWMFYASVHFGPTNTFWKDFSALNDYVSRCQSFLQTGTPDNDVLLYFPFYDRISQPGKYLLEHFRGGGPGLYISEFRETAKEMLDKGYQLDYISDNQIKNLVFKNGLIYKSGHIYKSIVLPKCNYISIETLKKLVSLAEQGAKIIFYKNLPADVPGLGQLGRRQKEFQSLLNSLDFTRLKNLEILEADVGRGSFLLGKNIDALLLYSGIIRESMVDKDLQCIRRKQNKDKIYFIVNRGEEAVDGWITIQTKAKSVAVFNPLYKIKGMAAIRISENGTNEIQLQLQPGESCILKAFPGVVKGPQYPYIKKAGESYSIDGEWAINFIEGGSALPEEIKAQKPDLWTNFGGDDNGNFSGTAKYSINFEIPDDTADRWLLEIEKIYESAVLILNGEELAILFAPPYSITIPQGKLKTSNLLEIKVTNLMANRISYLDRQGFIWKKFYNINFPANKRENRGDNGLFNASKWIPQKSGLTGPVTLTPYDLIYFE